MQNRNTSIKLLLQWENTRQYIKSTRLWRYTCFVGGPNQRPAGCVHKSHLIPNFFPMCKLFRGNIFLHLNTTTRHGYFQALPAVVNAAHQETRLTFRCRFVGCMYWPSVRQSTPASRSSAASTQAFRHNTSEVRGSVSVQRVHTCQSVEDLLVRLPEPQHDGRLGEQTGPDLFSVLQNTQGLVNVCSGVTNVSGNKKKKKRKLVSSFQFLQYLRQVPSVLFLKQKL